MLDVKTIQVINDILDKCHKLESYNLSSGSNSQELKKLGWKLLDTKSDSNFGRESSGSEGEKKFIIEVPELKSSEYLLIITITSNSYGHIDDKMSVRFGKGKTVTKTVFEVELD